MKRLLIISPYFPPANAADMQRVRMSLPYFTEFDWQVEVVYVDQQYVDIQKDELLLESIPGGIKTHAVKALNKTWTSRLGLGSLALRSLWFFKQKVDGLLKTSRFDLVYFSTTQFPVCILGAHWKKKFGVPYAIDFQDPWHSEYYRDKPKHQQPPKYWFSYRLNKYLEPLAMNHVDGVVSVSQTYIDDLKERYPAIAQVPDAVITFGHLAKDLDIAKANQLRFSQLLDPGFKNIVYIGRGGQDLHQSIKPVFAALKTGAYQFEKLRLYFIGTSYAPNGTGKPTIYPLAEEYGIQGQVVEITDRISYYHTLATLQQADALFIPGSDDPAYTASKIYPYLLTNKPILAIFHPQSPAIATLKDFGVANVYGYNAVTDTELNSFLLSVLQHVADVPPYNSEAIEKYSARQMTMRQCQLFDQVIDQNS